MDKLEENKYLFIWGLTHEDSVLDPRGVTISAELGSERPGEGKGVCREARDRSLELRG